MTGPPVTLRSKLPDVGTTIFTLMSALANKHQALNLSQGFPDFAAPERLVALVDEYMRRGMNQYPPMQGVMALRSEIAHKTKNLYGLECCPDEEVTVTAGATQALFCAIAAVVDQGDEVIVFDPAYDSYDPVIRLQGAHAVHVPLLAPDYRVDWQRVRAAVTPLTRMVIVNSPHNPTGMVFNAEDIAELTEIVESNDLFVLSDEVYEHMVFDGADHLSLCRFPQLYERSFVVSSFGKTYHVTGWKVGYCIAPAALSKEFRRVHQFVTFTVNTPVQHALADFMREQPEHYLQLADFYQSKRDLFCRLLNDSRFQLRACQGTYFQLLDYAALSDELDAELAKRWTKSQGIASIPISVFYANRDHCSQSALRFCFAKDDATLTQAAELLCRL